MAPTTTGPRAKCFHCGSQRTSKLGFYPNGKQRYKCRDCRRDFVDPARRTKTNGVPSEANLILKLRAVAQNLGKTPTAEDIRRLSKEGRAYTLDAYQKVFGTYSAALKRAGLRQNYRLTFNEKEKELMLFELRQLSRKLGRRVSTDDVRLARRDKLVPAVSHLEKAFGSIAAALDAAGVRVKTGWTEQELIAVLREVDLKLDRPVRKIDLEEPYRQGRCPSPKVFVARFGGMAKARRAAGIKDKFRFANGVTGKQQKYSREELIEQLKTLASRLGRRPVYRDIMAAPRTEIATAHTFSKMFGSLIAAYEAAGFKPKFKTYYPDKEIIASLRKLKRELGHFPTYREIRQANQNGECPSGVCIRARLGRLSEIKEWI